MQEMYRGLQQGKDTAEALRAAKLKLIADDYPPFFWAPFVLHGR